MSGPVPASGRRDALLLGIASLGWSTLVQVVDASGSDRAAAVEQLAAQLCARFGAPDLAAARAAASEELSFAASLAEHAPGTLIAMHRSVEDGEMREQFRTLQRREGQPPPRAFAFLDVEGEDDVEERVDLTALANAGREPR